MLGDEQSVSPYPLCHERDLIRDVIVQSKRWRGYCGIFCYCRSKYGNVVVVVIIVLLKYTLFKAWTVPMSRR